MEGVDRTAGAAADAARVRESDEPNTMATGKPAAPPSGGPSPSGGAGGGTAPSNAHRTRSVAAVFAGLLLAMFVSSLSETVTA